MILTTVVDAISCGCGKNKMLVKNCVETVTNHSFGFFTPGLKRENLSPDFPVKNTNPISAIEDMVRLPRIMVNR